MAEISLDVNSPFSSRAGLSLSQNQRAFVVDWVSGKESWILNKEIQKNFFRLKGLITNTQTEAVVLTRILPLELPVSDTLSGKSRTGVVLLGRSEMYIFLACRNLCKHWSQTRYENIFFPYFQHILTSNKALTFKVTKWGYTYSFHYSLCPFTKVFLNQ